MEFTYQLQHDPDAVIERVCALAQDRLVVSGNSRRGTFTGAFDGTYRVDGDKASIIIRRKPHFVSWTMVDQGLRLLVARG